MTRAFVTGGGGFLGLALVELLVAEGWQVTSGSRRRYDEVTRTGATSVTMDLGDADSVKQAVLDAAPDVVFHVAALAGVWGSRADFERTNVTGTENVIDACREAGVGRLVFTSSPSVCFDGADHVDASNDLPYPDDYLAHYPETKARAERAVLAANDERLATTAIRPHLIFGERDPHLFPRLIERARAGRLVIVGDAENEVSVTHVENAAAAHLDAARTLAVGSPHAGRAYFLGQKDPVKLWDWIAKILEGLDLPRPTRRVSVRTATFVGGFLETCWKLLPLSGEPPMTRFVAKQLGASHSYDLTPAMRDFGYVERVDLEAATARTIAAFRPTTSHSSR